MGGSYEVSISVGSGILKVEVLYEISCQYRFEARGRFLEDPKGAIASSAAQAGPAALNYDLRNATVQVHYPS